MIYSWNTPYILKAPGDVLSAEDVNNIESNVGYLQEESFKIGLASSNLTLTTSWADVTGATVTLGKVGTWRISIHVNFLFDTADPQLSALASIYHNGSVNSTNYIKTMSNGTANELYTQGSYTWRVFVSSAPYTVKIQGVGQSGMVGSSIRSEGTVIEATWVGTATS